MYSVLLVEDEKVELETLRDYINWERLSVDKVYTARNGRSALECVTENEPDIMITDIQMPVINGIELAKRVREEGYETKIVFLTGYDDFDYVKTAFQVQAIDYILKPFMAEEVEKLILSIEEQIRKEKTATISVHIAARQMMEQLCRGLNTEKEDLNNLSLQLLGHPANEPKYGILAVYGVSDPELLQKSGNELKEVYHSFLLDNMLVVVLYSHIYFQDGARRIGNLIGREYGIAYVAEKISLISMEEKVRVLKALADRIFFGEKGEIIEAESLSEQTEGQKINRETLHTALADLHKNISSGDEKKAEEELNLFFNEWSKVNKEECIREAYSLYLYFKMNLVMEDQWLNRWMKDENEPTEKKILEGCYFKDICNSLIEYIAQILAYFKKQHEDPNYPVIARVKDYLERNYSATCSVKEIADNVHLSPNYLRNIFKERTGQTILEYVTDYRLLKACELLKDKTRKVKEIGSQVGYEDLSYFCSVFIKRYGVTPNEYRKMV